MTRLVCMSLAAVALLSACGNETGGEGSDPNRDRCAMECPGAVDPVDAACFNECLMRACSDQCEESSDAECFDVCFWGQPVPDCSFPLPATLRHPSWGEIPLNEGNVYGLTYAETGFATRCEVSFYVMVAGHDPYTDLYVTEMYASAFDQTFWSGYGARVSATGETEMRHVGVSVSAR